MCVSKRTFYLSLFRVQSPPLVTTTAGNGDVVVVVVDDDDRPQQYSSADFRKKEGTKEQCWMKLTCTRSVVPQYYYCLCLTRRNFRFVVSTTTM